MMNNWNKYRIWWAVLALGYALLCIHIKWGIWAYAGLLLFSAADIWYNRKTLFSNITRLLSVGAVTGIAFGIGKVITLKYFNMQYGILSEYLNYSVTVFTCLFALPVLLGFALLFGASVFILGMSFYSVWQFAKNSLPLALLLPQQNTSSKNDLPYLIHVLSAFILSFLLLSGASQIAAADKWALWLDAYQNTDCGNGFSLRRDKEHCYRFIRVQGFPWIEMQLLSVQKND